MRVCYRKHLGDPWAETLPSLCQVFVLGDTYIDCAAPQWVIRFQLHKSLGLWTICGRTFLMWQRMTCLCLISCGNRPMLSSGYTKRMTDRQRIWYMVFWKPLLGWESHNPDIQRFWQVHSNQHTPHRFPSPRPPKEGTSALRFVLFLLSNDKQHKISTSL